METVLPVRFEEPLWLLLLPLLLPLTWRIGRRSLAGLPKLRGRLALGVRLLLVFALVAALARPQINRSDDSVAVYFVVDVSGSIPPEKLRAVQSGLGKITKAKPDDDMVGLIYFGADAACEMPPSELPFAIERQSIVRQDGTDIASALRLAASTFPAPLRKRIVLVTDGNQNRNNAFVEVERLRSQGIQLDVLPVEYESNSEIMVEKALLPDQTQPGVPFAVRVLVSSTHAADAVIIVKRAGAVVRRDAVRLRKGRNSFSLPLVIDADEKAAGIKSFEVSVHTVNSDDDRMADNNTAYAFTRLTGPPSVLYIDGNIGMSEGYKPLLHEALLNSLRLVRESGQKNLPEITLTLHDTGSIPVESELSSYDCIILDNIAAESLGAARMERIRALVNGQGTGLVMIGGENSFGVGNYRNTPIEAALPVDMDLKNKKIMPNGALILAVDRSGSMSGNKLAQAKAAAWAAVEVLSPTDYIGIIAFDGSPQWLVKPVLASNRYAIRKKIASLGAGGGTDIMAAMQAAYKALVPLRAALKHVVVLSDGQSPNHGFSQLMNSMKRHKITASSVGIGDKSGQRLMQDIAKFGGGRFYYVKNPKKLPRIFIKESRFVKRGLLFEDTFTPAVTDANDEFLEDTGAGGLPPLHGYVAATAKPEAYVPLVSTNENKDPILSHWRYGLGRSVAFASDAKNRWGRDWLAWDGFANFWSGAVYRVLRQKPANLRLTTKIDGRRGVIVVHALDAEGNPMPFLDLTASVTDPDAKVKKIKLSQTGVCTYEAEFEADGSGRYEVAVVDRGESSGMPSAAYGGASKPFSAESTSLKSDEQVIHRLASLGGGSVLDVAGSVEQVYRRDGLAPAAFFRDWWAGLLALVALLFPLDILIRRVMIDYKAMWRWTAERYAAWWKAAPVVEARVARLMEAKQRATGERVNNNVMLNQFESAAESSGHDLKDLQEKAVENMKTRGVAPAKQEAPAGDSLDDDSPMARLLRAKKRAHEDRKR